MNKTVTPILYLVCQEPLSVRPTRGRKSGKPSLMLICPSDGRHFRGFITDQSYVSGVLDRLQAISPEKSTHP